jgi:hypothetical protein
MINQPAMAIKIEVVIKRNQKKCGRVRLKKSIENQKLYTDDNIPWNRKTFIDNIFTLKTKPKIRSLNKDIIK